MDKIVLPKIDVMACHGVEDWEREMQQPFHIAVELWLDLQPAALSGELSDTVHYGQLYAAVKSLAESQSYGLIESLAEAAAKLCLEDHRVQKARVSVEKSQARFADYTFPAQVIIERSRK